MNQRMVHFVYKSKGGANASNEWSKEWKGCSRQQHQSLGNVVSHARIIHQHGHRHKTADGDGRLL